MSSAPSSEFGAYIHPDDARMAAWRRVYERYLVVEDIYPELARRVAAHGARSFVEAGGGRGPMARLLQPEGVLTAVVDLDDQMLAETCPPAIKADLGYLPISDRSVDAVATINCLYFLADPAAGVREAARVLRSGGLFLASAPSRWNDPELEGVDPRWGQPSPFDSEDAPAIVGSVFGDVELDTWEAVAYRLPDRQAVGDYLHGINVPEWETKVDLLPVPLEITKRGANVWAYCR